MIDPEKLPGSAAHNGIQVVEVRYNQYSREHL